jgi:hypothetical protein
VFVWLWAIVRLRLTSLITKTFDGAWPILPQSGAINPPMRTIAVIFVLALMVIAAEIYSDAVLTRGAVTAAPDPASAAIAHGLKRHG